MPNSVIRPFLPLLVALYFSIAPVHTARAEILTFLAVAGYGISFLADLMELSKSGADVNAQLLRDNREALRSLNKQMHTLGHSLTEVLKKIDRLDMRISKKMEAALAGQTKRQVAAIVAEFALQRSIATKLSDLDVVWDNPVRIRELLQELVLLHGELSELDDLGLPILLMAMNTERIMRTGLGENTEAVAERMEVYYRRLDRMLDSSDDTSLIAQWRYWGRMEKGGLQSVVSHFSDYGQRASVLEVLHPRTPSMCGRRESKQGYGETTVSVTVCELRKRAEISAKSYLILTSGLAGSGEAISANKDLWLKWLSEEEKSTFLKTVEFANSLNEERLGQLREAGLGEHWSIESQLEMYYLAVTWNAILAQWVEAVKSLVYYRPGSYAERRGRMDFVEEIPPAGAYSSFSRGACDEFPTLSDKDCFRMLEAQLKAILGRPAGEWFYWIKTCVNEVGRQSKEFTCSESRPRFLPSGG